MDVRTWALKNVGRTILNLRADPLLTSPIFPSENSSVQLFPGASVEIEQDRMEEEQILHLRRKGLLLATSLTRLLYTSSSSSHSSSSSSASSRSSSSSSQSSASSSSSSVSSSSSSTTPAPRIILTISGTPGSTFMGLGIGVHTVSPTTYQASPEIWTKNVGLHYDSTLALSAYQPSYSTALHAKKTHSFRLGAFIYSTFSTYFGSGYTTKTLPFTSGPATTKIKNRAFGQITTSAGMTISWQRATNWPDNP